jgi:beta-glucosidase
MGRAGLLALHQNSHIYLGLTDGPHGVGPHGTGWKKNTFFSCGILMGATWNPALLEAFGAAVGRESRACGRHVQLGPGMNIHRSPLCGRTFEYLSEDPYLAKRLAPATIRGLQSQRIAACAKHYACNDQETHRMSVSAEVGERALREIHLPAFEACVRDGGAWTFMSCYNRVNGTFGAENRNLITDRLRNEWGFKGFVMSDWGATTHASSTETCVNAGLSLDMHVNIQKLFIKMSYGKLRRAFAAGKFTEETLNENVRRLLRVMFLVGLFDDPDTLPKGERNTSEHQALARKLASDGMVLLKNDRKMLPLDMGKVKKLAVVGPFARKKTALRKRLEVVNLMNAGGSSTVLPPYEITPLQGITGKCAEKVEIVNSPAGADVAIVVVGTGHAPGGDDEGFDRKGLELPAKQVMLIQETVAQNPNTIVVLVNGSPVSMEGWIDKVPAVLEAWYGGMEAGHAIADILFGDVNPSGKLPTTFPKKLSDSPAHASGSKRTWPGEGGKVYYDEGIFVGYRHFDKEGIEPLFPFGHGLSYTTFEYGNVKASKAKLSGDEGCKVSVDVKNTGQLAGAEVVQLYVQDVEASVPRPPKELKGFRKVFLQPGEQATVTLDIGKADLSFFDEKRGKWVAEPGKFVLHVGSSSRDIRGRVEIELG